jgi:Asp-tRNA(Asn)/Glu-tRNA(Gln) amidotransferase A subunit family amidase
MEVAWEENAMEASGDAAAKKLSYDPNSPPLLKFHKAIAAFVDGTDTPRAYLERCLETIAALNPTISAWVHMDEAIAQKAADEATDRYAKGRPFSLIDGCPMAVKDIIETADMPTQMNSAIYKDWQSLRDAASVYALRESGAVIIGKTVTTEFATGAAGPTSNPFDPGRTPGGSSSGTAASVGSGMVPVGLGTQTAGSVLRPAAYCGAFGFKPTHASLNMGGIHPISNTHDALGTIAGSVDDCWRTAYQIARIVGGTAPHPGMVGPASLDDALKPLRLIRLYTDGWAEVEDATKEAFEGLIRDLKAKGVEIVDKSDGDDITKLETLLEGIDPIARTITQYERRWPFNDYYERHRDKLSPELRQSMEKTMHLTQEQFDEAVAHRAKIRHQVDALGVGADGFITLTAAGPAPKGLKSTGNRSFQIAWTLTSTPAITLPLLAVDDMPLGVQVMGFCDKDERLARNAKWITKAILG